MGWATGAVDPLPCLRSPKMLKFMGKQDRLAVVAAARAVEGLAECPESTGLYLAVGSIPFELADLEPLARHSVRDGRFCMEAFSTAGLDQVNPLLTFRCLPNMPAFHVSLSLGIRGPSYTTYPGPGQFYQALQEAVWALSAGEVERALVGGVADQDNFLVRTQKGPGQDAAGFLCLERQKGIPLLELEIEYRPGQPSREEPSGAERSGPGGLAYWLAQGVREHEIQAEDGIWARSRWAQRIA